MRRRRTMGTAREHYLTFEGQNSISRNHAFQAEVDNVPRPLLCNSRVRKLHVGKRELVLLPFPASMYNSIIYIYISVSRYMYVDIGTNVYRSN